MNAQPNNLNTSRSQATRERLIEAAIAALIEQGYSRTTGVEVCRRAGLTRGALNHHYSDFSELLIDVLRTVYERLFTLESPHPTTGLMESLVHRGFEQVCQPEFKVLIELWLAARNDPQFGARLTDVIDEGAMLFSPDALLLEDSIKDKDAFRAIYRTIFEAMIGLGLGRTVSGGEPVAHEPIVMGMLLDMARRSDADNH